MKMTALNLNTPNMILASSSPWFFGANTGSVIYCFVLFFPALLEASQSMCHPLHIHTRFDTHYSEATGSCQLLVRRRIGFHFFSCATSCHAWCAPSECGTTSSEANSQAVNIELLHEQHDRLATYHQCLVSLLLMNRVEDVLPCGMFFLTLMWYLFTYCCYKARLSMRNRSY